GTAGLFLDQNPGQTGGGFNGAVTLSGDGTFNVVNNVATGVAMQMTVNGPVTGAFGVIKNGTGTLTLNTASTYSGTTTVNNGTLLVTGSSSISDNMAVQVNGGTMRFSLSSGPAVVGLATSVAINNSATLELAGAISALSDGTAAHSANITNNSTAIAGLHVIGTNQKVGGIDGSGTTQVDSGSDLTANHIIQGALVIGGAANSPALVTIAAS